MEGNVIRMDVLTKMYETIQSQQCLEIKGATTQLLKARLINRFGNEISFFQKDIGTVELIYSNATSCKNYISTDIDKVKKVAQMIKKEVNNLNSPFTSWPPTPDEVKNDNVHIPELLKTLLTEILVSGLETVRTSTLVSSIAQDIMFNATSVKLKTVKQLQLGIFTKRKTGSKMMIQCLNRLGHSVSYSEVNKFETSIAERKSTHKYAKLPPK